MVLQQLKKTIFLEIQEKGLKIFLGKVTARFEQQQDFSQRGVFHAAVGMEAKADDLD